jgi:hypothetical protein
MTPSQCTLSPFPDSVLFPQEQERAYYLLREQSMAARAAAEPGSDAEGHVGSEEEEVVYEEGEYVPGEGNGGEENAEGAPFDDEAFARALQEAEEREAEERVLALAGMNVGSGERCGYILKKGVVCALVYVVKAFAS